MKSVLQILVKIIDWTRAICSFLAFAYGFIWLLSIFGVRFAGLNALFDPCANLVKRVIDHKIVFEDQTYESAYIITALIFVGIFFVVTKLHKQMLEGIDSAIFAENLRRARSDLHTNDKIKKDVKSHILKIGHYIICLNLNLKYIITESLLTKKFDLVKLRQENYEKIAEEMKQISNLDVDIRDDKIFIIGHNYANFEQVFNAFLDITSAVSQQNRGKEIVTEIYFVIDGSESDHIGLEKREFLKKILSFGYKNKAVTTVAFAKRYEQEKNNAFILNTMGAIRFFEDKINGQTDQGYSDFELFTLKRKRG